MGGCWAQLWREWNRIPPVHTYGSYHKVYRFLAHPVDKIDRMIKRSSHGCFHIGPISRSRSSSALGYLLGLIIDARPWYTGLHENSRVITSKYWTPNPKPSLFILVSVDPIICYRTVRYSPLVRQSDALLSVTGFTELYLPVGIGFSSSSSVSESRKEHHFGAGPSDYNTNAMPD